MATGKLKMGRLAGLASELDQESKIRTKVKDWQCHPWRRFKLAWGTLSVFHSQTGINLGIFHKCRHWGLSNLSLGKYYSKTDQNKMALLCKSGKGRQERKKKPKVWVNDAVAMVGNWGMNLGPTWGWELLAATVICLENPTESTEYYC